MNPKNLSYDSLLYRVYIPSLHHLHTLAFWLLIVVNLQKKKKGLANENKNKNLYEYKSFINAHYKS